MSAAVLARRRLHEGAWCAANPQAAFAVRSSASRVQRPDARRVGMLRFNAAEPTTSMKLKILYTPLIGDYDTQLQLRTILMFGLIAVMYDWREDGVPILDLVESRVTGDKQEFQMYRAFAEAGGRHTEYAHRVLGERIRRDPDDDMAKVAMGVALRMAGDPEWRYLVDNVLAISVDQQARQSALLLLDPPPLAPLREKTASFRPA
jgi:hypothetical protein